MRYGAVVSVLLFVGNAQVESQTPRAMAPGPKSPQESLKCLQPRPGFVVDLMAAEPLVQDPIAFAWGPDGKFWVVEMGDYPLGVDGKNKPGGRVKFLEKTRPDGPYDKATLFLDNLGYPTGVTPWGKGVLVTCAPDIFYAEDTTGSGRADKKVVLYTGFREGNQQHRVNGLVWGLDNWLYGANGDSGGVVKSLKTGQAVNISGRDFRIKPDLGLIEAVTGQTQFGRARDDWGNWFGCNNSNPMYHFVLDDGYLKRNPHLLPPEPRVNVSEKPGAARVYPISKPLPRFNSPEGLNHFTSACSAIVYRDDLFGPDFTGNSFVSEPVHNLVHREIMTPRGVTFTSKRAHEEQESEFLASTDNWFRPTMIQTGPDGALWIADMYRYVIEHPEWIPADWQKKLDLRAGHDKGRIYRIFPKDKKPREVPRLDKLSTKELVAALDSPSGWQRDTAQQLLLARPAEITAPLLEKLLHESDRAATRAHALMTLHGIGKLSDEALRHRLGDSSPGVRRWAVYCCESRLPTGALQKALKELVNDPDALVRLQLACAVGHWRRAWAADLFLELAEVCRDDTFLEAALLSSITKDTHQAIGVALRERSKGAVPRRALQQLLAWSAATGDGGDLQLSVLAATLPPGDRFTAEHFRAMGDLLDLVEKNKLSWSKLRAPPESAAPMKRLQLILHEARVTAADEKAPLEERVVATRLLGRGPTMVAADRKQLQELLVPQSAQLIQSAALRALANFTDLDVGEYFIAQWRTLTPGLRSQLLDVLLGRPEWTKLAVSALQAGKIQPGEVDAVRRQRLLDHKDPLIRTTAAKVFTSVGSTERSKIVAEYQPAMALSADFARGEKLFAKHCAVCHQLVGKGGKVGPDLASVADKSVQGLLVAILDPNRAVEPRYINYLATTKSGVTHSGILQSETSSSITLGLADGKFISILRAELDDLTSTGKSAMPEGLEKEIPPQDMADLIAFVRGQLPLPKAKSIPGNQPILIKADKQGVLNLLPSNGAIFGKTLILEEKYKNLGFWSSDDDHVVWAVEVPKAAAYIVEMEWACANDSAGNSFTLEAAGERLMAKVKGTGTWDDYRQAPAGLIMLPMGRIEITMRAIGPIRGAMIDLKGIRLAPK